MTRRAMIIPAAGSGSRLGAALPKLMVAANGRPLLDHLIERYAPFIEEFHLVVSPAAEQLVRTHVAQLPASIHVAVQEKPTGMLDAVMIPLPELESLRPLQVWVTWCDQIATQAETVQRLAAAADAGDAADLVFPTLRRNEPYIHFERDEHGTISRILHRREGDAMPDTGESDMGLFVMSDSACFDMLPAYAREVVPGTETGERNYLPFIVWAGRHGTVATINGTHPMESVGINTREELRMVERWLRDV